MALHFDLCVNHSPIASFQAIRRTNTGGRPNPNDVSTYEVRVVSGPFQSEMECEVEHRYGDGALVLVRRALNQMAGIPDDQHCFGCNHDHD